MTDQLPFSGPAEGILLAKQTLPPPSPDAFIEGLPDDLVALCVALLDRDAIRRPTGRDFDPATERPRSQLFDVPEINRTLPLIGRSRHRRVLEDCLRRAPAEDRVRICIWPDWHGQDDAGSIVPTS